MSKKPNQPDSLRAEAEAELAHAPETKQMPRPAEKLQHELQVHQIELEMQNEQLRQSEVELEKSRDRYVDFYDFAPVGYLTLNHQGMIDEINLTGAALLKVARNKLPYHRFASFVAMEDRDRWHRHFLSVLKHDNSLSCELALQHDNGPRFYAQLDCLRLKKEGKEPVVRIVLTDITERKKADLALRDSENRFRNLVETTSDWIWEVDENIVYTYASPNIRGILGYKTEEVIGKTPFDFMPPEEVKRVADMFDSIVAARKYFTNLENTNLHKDGHPVILETSGVPVIDPEGKFCGYRGMDRDITMRKQVEEQIRALAFYDALTQLPNRRLLNDRLEQAMAASKRSGRYGALMFLDMDNFKPLNDTHGHDVGDLLLMEAAQRLTRCVREMDTVARFGGDEFMVMLGELDADKAESATQAGIVAEKICATLAEPYMLKLECEVKTETTVEHRCTTSIGVVLFIDHQARTEEIIKWADMAMYQAKQAGGNLIRFYESTGE